MKTSNSNTPKLSVNSIKESRTESIKRRRDEEGNVLSAEMKNAFEKMSCLTKSLIKTVYNYPTTKVEIKDGIKKMNWEVTVLVEKCKSGK